MAHLPFDDVAHLADALPTRQLAHLHHLLGCRLCRRRLIRLLPELAPEAVPVDEPAVSRLYRSVFERLERVPSEELAPFAMGTAEADAVIAELVRLPARTMERRFRQRPPAQVIPVLLRLLDRAYEESYPFPSRGNALAELAFRLSGGLDDAGLPPAILADLKARIHLLRGYTEGLERTSSDMGDLPFRVAESHIAHPDEVEAAVFCRLLGSVRDRQRRTLEALSLLERAARLFHDSGERVEEALALSEQAAIYARLGDSARALALFGRALALKEAWLPPAEAVRERLLLALMHHAVGHPWAAQEALAEAGKRAAADEVCIPALLLLTRARLAADGGDRGETERLLAEALVRGNATKAFGEAAAAAFHLAILGADAGQRHRLAGLAEDMEPLFAPETLPSALRDCLRDLRALLRTGNVAVERVVSLQRRFRERLPGGAGPLHGLVILFEPDLSGSLLRGGPPASLLPFTGDRTPRRPSTHGD